MVKKSPRATAAEARSGRRTRRTTVDRRSGDGSASAALRRKTIVENISRVGVARRESETSFRCGPATRRTPAEDAARNAGVAVADESADTSPRRIVRSARRSGLDEDIREPKTKTPRHEDAGRRARKILRNTGRIPHSRMREDTRQLRRGRASLLYSDGFKDGVMCKMNARVVCNDCYNVCSIVFRDRLREDGGSRYVSRMNLLKMIIVDTLQIDRKKSRVEGQTPQITA
ncbi:hypothetical protein Hamer_G010132, partial [Homarus americanus]